LAAEFAPLLDRCRWPGSEEAPQLADDAGALLLSHISHPALVSASPMHCRPIWTSPSGSTATAGSATPSTSIPIRSGADSSIAFSIAVFMVTVDDGQPWQLPSRRRRITPSS